jgi:nucleotide-binding universal stress UspA family protein
MPHIQRILHPTDFSPAAAAAFEFACALARDHNASLILLHVAQQPVTNIAGMPVVPPSPPQINRKGLDAQLRAIAAANPQLRVECSLREGEPAGTIVNVARDRACDAIVMGTHGWTGLSRLLMGSVAEQVVRRATCPVVTVKSPAKAAG